MSGRMPRAVRTMRMRVVKRSRPLPLIATDEPDMPSPCCGRGGFLHHIEEDDE